MTNLDEEIRKALSGDEIENIGSIAAEQGMFAMMFGVFRGKMRLWSAFAMVLTFAAFGVAVWAGWNFLQTSDPHAMTLWGIGMGISIFFVGMLKLWFWMEMQKNAVIREVKRVELQLAVLSSALRDKGVL
jgi:Family of unknown function (DUF6768)